MGGHPPWYTDGTGRAALAPAMHEERYGGRGAGALLMPSCVLLMKERPRGLMQERPPRGRGSDKDRPARMTTCKGRVR